MGMFNGTCFISGTPIRGPKERVAAVALLPEKDALPEVGEQYMYITTMFRPYPIYIRGRYNEYGGVEIDDAPEVYKLFGGKEKAAEFFNRASRNPDTNRRDKYCLALAHETMWQFALDNVKLGPGAWPPQMILQLEQSVAPLEPVAKEICLRWWKAERRLSPIGNPEVDAALKCLEENHELPKYVGDRIHEVARVGGFLQRICRMWMPQYSHPQDVDWTIHKKLAAKILQYGKRKKDGYG